MTAAKNIRQAYTYARQAGAPSSCINEINNLETNLILPIRHGLLVLMGLILLLKMYTYFSKNGPANIKIS